MANVTEQLSKALIEIQYQITDLKQKYWDKQGGLQQSLPPFTWIYPEGE